MMFPFPPEVYENREEKGNLLGLTVKQKEVGNYSFQPTVCERVQIVLGCWLDFGRLI
jgi:hypothetical protein